MRLIIILILLWAEIAFGINFGDIPYNTSEPSSIWVPPSRTLTINGTAFDLSADRSWTVSAGSVAWGTITGTLSSQTDLQNALNLKADKSITLTINGVTFDLSANRTWTIPTGVAWGAITGTLSSQTDLQTALNGKVPTTRNLTINGTTFDLSADRTWTIPATTPGGSNTQFQYNNSNAFGGVSSTTYDGTTVQQLSGSKYQLVDPASATKKVQFDLSSLTAGFTRNVVIADSSTSNTVIPDNGAANNFLTGISGFGVISKAQPSFTNISGTATTAQGGAPSGGTTSQVLTKNSNTNYDYSWATPSSGTIGGSIASPQVAFGSGSNTITGDSKFTYSTTTGLNSTVSDTTVNAVTNALTIGHQETAAGTPAPNMGTGFVFNIPDQGGTNQAAAAINAAWTDATVVNSGSYIDFKTRFSASSNNAMRITGQGGLNVGNAQLTNNSAAGVINIASILFANGFGTGGQFVQSDGSTSYGPSVYSLPTTVSGANNKFLQVLAGSVAVSTSFWPTSMNTGWIPMASSNNTVVQTQFGGVASITSTVDQTATAETTHVNFTVNANTAVAGTTYRITAWGNIDNGTTAITFTPRVRWGGTGGTQLIATPTIVGTTTALTNKDWKAVADINIRTIGATGTALCSLALSNHTAQTSGAYSADQASSGATAVTIDTTVNKSLELTWSLSATTGTPHVRTYGGVIEVVKQY